MSQRLNAGAVPKSRIIQDFLMKPNPVTGAVGLVVPERTVWNSDDGGQSFTPRVEDVGT